MTAPPILQGIGLVRRLGDRDVVDRVDLSVAAGEVVGLFGPNGAGKTTLLRVLAGVLPPSGGTVRLAGEDVTRLGLAARARRGLGFLAQESTVFRALTALDNVVAYLEAARAPAADRRARALALLARVGLSERAEQRADSLSGGERRRLEVARALALAPRVLICDEPLAGIDRPSAAALARELRSIACSESMAVLFCDHGLEVALPECDRALFLEAGRIRPMAKSWDTLTHERILSL